MASLRTELASVGEGTLTPETVKLFMQQAYGNLCELFESDELRDTTFTAGDVSGVSCAAYLCGCRQSCDATPLCR